MGKEKGKHNHDYRKAALIVAKRKRIERDERERKNPWLRPNPPCDITRHHCIAANAVAEVYECGRDKPTVDKQGNPLPEQARRDILEGVRKGDYFVMHFGWPLIDPDPEINDIKIFRYRAEALDAIKYLQMIARDKFTRGFDPDRPMYVYRNDQYRVAFSPGQAGTYTQPFVITLDLLDGGPWQVMKSLRGVNRTWRTLKNARKAADDMMAERNRNTRGVLSDTPVPTLTDIILKELGEE